MTSLGIVLCLLVALLLQPAMVAIVEPDLLQPKPVPPDDEGNDTATVAMVVATTTTTSDTHPSPDAQLQAPR